MKYQVSPMKVRIGFQFWLSSTLYGYPKYILQDSPIRGLTKCCGGSETKWIIIIYMTMLIRFLKKKKPTDAVRVARPPRIGVSPGFDSQDSVNFFTKYCFPNLHWIHDKALEVQDWSPGLLTIQKSKLDKSCTLLVQAIGSGVSAIRIKYWAISN